jgi:hypothetical protein
MLRARVVSMLSHEFQTGTITDDPDITRFNSITQGVQDILFPYQRYAADVMLAGRHRSTLLCQPFTPNPRTVADRNRSNGCDDIVIDGVHFDPGTMMDLTCGFDFWRVSYRFDFAPGPASPPGPRAAHVRPG